jgi:hypothetical protein
MLSLVGLAPIDPAERVTGAVPVDLDIDALPDELAVSAITIGEPRAGIVVASDRLTAGPARTCPRAGRARPGRADQVDPSARAVPIGRARRARSIGAWPHR